MKNSNFLSKLAGIILLLVVIAQNAAAGIKKTEKRILRLLVISLFVWSIRIDVWAQMVDDRQIPPVVWSYDTIDEESTHYVTMSFYEMLKEIFIANGENFESVLDEVFIFNKPDLKHEVADAFAVPPMIFDDAISVGDILCRIMGVRYCGPHSECLDFLKIQYSSRPWDFRDYLSQYPNSHHWKEATAKYLLTKIYMACKSAQRHDNEMKYNDFFRIYKRYSEEYCEIFGDEDETEVDCEYHYLHQLNYEGYMRTPIELYVKYAEKRIEELNEKKQEEESLWMTTCENNRYEDYWAYHQQYPDGRHTDETMMELRQHELPTWQQVVLSNTREAYEDFLSRYPDGYYSTHATNNILDLFQAVHHKAKEILFPSSLSMHLCGNISKVGFVNSCLKGYSYTLTFAGETGRRVTLRPGETFWIELPEAATVPVLLESTSDDSWIGELEFHGGIFQIYIEDTHFEDIDIISFQDPAKLNTNTKAVAKLIREAYDKYGDELQWIPAKK